MTNSTISDQEIRVLALTQFNARLSVPEISKSTGLRTHSIHYALARLREREVIRPWALINLYALGYEEYEIFFSLGADSNKTKDKLLLALRGDERVLWVAELGGDYQYAMTVFARDAAAVSSFLESLTVKFGNVFKKKMVAVIVSLSFFKKKYLFRSVKKFVNESVTIERPRKIVQLDEIDRQILSVLFLTQCGSHRAMAEKSGIPRATIEYRLKRLSESGVLLKYIYFISAAKLGIGMYKLLITGQGIQPELGKQLYTFSLAEPNVVNFMHCIGAWDYELGAEVSHAPDVVALAEKLYRVFGGLITDIRILPVFSQYNSNNFMKYAGSSERE